MFGALLGLAGSLFAASSQKKQAQQQNANNAEMQAIQNEYNTEAAALERANSIADLKDSLPRLRESAEAAGYNPLTALSVGGAPGYASPASGVAAKQAVAKLASPSLIGNVVSGVAEVVTGIEAQKAQQKRSEQQLAEINRQRTLGDVPKVAKVYRNTSSNSSATAKIPKAAGVATLGAKPATPQDNAFEAGPNSLAPGRQVDAINPANSAGVFAINNKLTRGEDIIMPGDTEPWGIDELATAAIVGLPQLAYKGYQKLERFTSDAMEVRAASQAQMKAAERKNLQRKGLPPLTGQSAGGNTLPPGDWSHLSNSELSKLNRDYNRTKGTWEEEKLMKFYNKRRPN